MISDPYKVLGLPPNAPEEEVARAYRALAKKYHPDINHGSADSAKKMSEINAAYEQIKSGKTSSGAENGYTGGNADSTGTGANGSSDPFGFGFNPFEGFDPFTRGYGANGDQKQDDEQRRQDYGAPLRFVRKIVFGLFISQLLWLLFIRIF